MINTRGLGILSLKILSHSEMTALLSPLDSIATRVLFYSKHPDFLRMTLSVRI